MLLFRTGKEQSAFGFCETPKNTLDFAKIQRIFQKKKEKNKKNRKKRGKSPEKERFFQKTKKREIRF